MPTNNKISTKKTLGLNSFQLKIIAVISMFIDHIGAIIIEEFFNYPALNFISDKKLFNIYFLMRSIGRIAFPIFCFLIVQGYINTRNVKKYLIRLLIFSFISEIPFNMANFGKLLEFSHQNVFFTLFFGLLSLYIYDFISKKILNNFSINLSSKQIIDILIIIGIFTIIGYITYILNTDYSYHGILLILLLYIANGNKIMTGIFTFIGIFFEISMPIVLISIPLILSYNEKKGKNLKYFFYFFYPVHLFVLYLVKIYFLKIL